MNKTLPFAPGDLVKLKSKPNLAPRKISRIDPESSTYSQVMFEDGGGDNLDTIIENYELFIPVVNEEMSFKVLNNEPKVTIGSSVECYITVNGIDIPVNGDMEYVFSEIKDCDGGMARYLFEDSELERAMLAAGLVFKNVRGSYGRTNLFLKLYDKLVALSAKEYDVKCNTDWQPTPENIEKLPTVIKEYILLLQSKVVE